MTEPLRTPDELSPSVLAARLTRLFELVGPLRGEAHLVERDLEYRAGIRDLCSSRLAAYTAASTVGVVCAEMVAAHYSASGRPAPEFWAFDPDNLGEIPDSHLEEGIRVAAQIVSTLLNHDPHTTSALLMARIDQPLAFFMTLAGLLSLYAGLWSDPAARTALDALDLESVLTQLMPTPPAS